MKSLEIQSLEINNKSIYIFEDHSLAFKAWLNIRNRIDGQSFVITLDHHTDTHQPLCYFSASEKYKSDEVISYEDFYERIIQTHFENLDLYDEHEVNSFVMKLHYDEHISSAIQKEIITHSISIQWDHNSGTQSIEENEYDKQPTLKDLYTQFGFEEGKQKYSDLQPAPIPPFSYKLPANRMFIVGYSHFD